MIMSVQDTQLPVTNVEEMTFFGDRYNGQIRAIFLKYTNVLILIYVKDIIQVFPLVQSQIL